MTAPKMELRRTVEALPDRVGDFYGRYKGTKEVRARKVEFSPPVPHGRLMVLDYRGIEWIPIELFDWFGPVPTCVEAGT